MPTKTLAVQELINRSISEEELQNQIIQAAYVNGWIIHAERPAWSTKGYRTPIQGDAGFHDLVLCHPGQKRVIFAELKRENGKTTLAQEGWLVALAKCGQEVYLLRPSDLDTFLKKLEAR